MPEFKKYKEEERSFLHGISTPLMVAMSQLELLLAKSSELGVDESLEKVKKAKAALQKVSSAVHERRNQIKSQEDE